MPVRGSAQVKASAHEEFEAIAIRAATGDAQALGVLPSAIASARDLYRAGQLDKKLWDTMAAAVRSVIDDDILTVEEEDYLHRLGDVLGTPVQQLEQRNHGLFEELVIAGINGGRSPDLMTQASCSNAARKPTDHSACHC